MGTAAVRARAVDAVIALAIETATSAVSVALGGSERIAGAVEINQGRRHAEVLTPAIEFLCAHTGISLDRIDAIGVDIGPGLFTGMRVGIATANALGFALGVPVVGVTSLDVLAHGVASATVGQLIATVVDARKGQVFYAFHRVTSNGPVLLDEPRAGSADDVHAAALGHGGDVIVVGDGARREEAEPGASRHSDAPSAVSLVGITVARASRGAVGTPNEVRPLYLRAPDALINWGAR